MVDGWTTVWSELFTVFVALSALQVLTVKTMITSINYVINISSTEWMIKEK